MDKHEPHWQATLESLRQTSTQVAMVVTGGGAGSLARCFRREGASQNFVEAAIPYSNGALEDYLGSPPSDSSASRAVAKQLARVAWLRAGRLGSPSADDRGSGDPAAVGIALTAALPTTPRRRGIDRIHTALHTASHGVTWSVELPKNAFTRESAEAVADAILLTALSTLVDGPSDAHLLENLDVEIVREEFEP